MTDATNTPHTTTDTQPSTTHMYFSPRKVILTKENLEAFQASKTHETIVSYITALNERVVGVKLTDEVPLSPVRKSFPSAVTCFPWADCLG